METGKLYIYGADYENYSSRLLLRLEGFDVRVSIDQRSPRLPDNIGDACRVKVFNPVESEDVDGDWKAWRFDFTATKVELMSSVLCVYGYSFKDHWGEPDVGFSVCEDEHEPWEHDGICGSKREEGYVGPLELRYYQGEPSEPVWESRDELDFGTNRLAEVK